MSLIFRLISMKHEFAYNGQYLSGLPLEVSDIFPLYRTLRYVFLYNKMWPKTAILLLLLITCSYSQDTLASSDDGSSSASAPSSKDLPSDIPQPAEASSQGQPVNNFAAPPTAAISGGGSATSNQNNQDWSYVQGSSDQRTNSRWIFPEGSYQIYPRYWFTTFTITFSLDCPQNPITFIYASTGLSYVFINGKLIKSGAAPYPSYHTVTINPSDLKCGCNVIRVLVYNYYYPSPAAITYRLTQNTNGCYNCQNQGVTFYNKDTCKCQCATPAQNCGTRLKIWMDYPSCGCKCTDGPVICSSGWYWRWDSCSCQCKKKCCGTNEYFDTNQCRCVPLCTQPINGCAWPRRWSQANCRCQCTNSCPYPQAQNPQTCTCSGCSIVQQCTWPYVWNSNTCSCQCTTSNNQCQSPQIWNTNTCRCDYCPQQPCQFNQVWDFNACRCVNRCVTSQICTSPYVWSWTACSCVYLGPRPQPSVQGLTQPSGGGTTVIETSVVQGN